MVDEYHEVYYEHVMKWLQKMASIIPKASQQCHLTPSKQRLR
jgi:hypothetical protein